MKRIFLITLVSMLLLVLAAPAWACRMEMSLIGDPYGGASWSQEFEYYNTNSRYDAIELFITSGGIFKNDGFRDFTDPSWSGSYINKHYALASGDYPGFFYLYYTVDFAGDMSEPLSLDMIVWKDGVFGTLVSFHQLNWDGSEWEWYNIGPGLVDSTTFDDLVALNRNVPEPSTMLLLGVGLMGIGFLRRSFKR